MTIRRTALLITILSFFVAPIAHSDCIEKYEKQILRAKAVHSIWKTRVDQDKSDNDANDLMDLQLKKLAEGLGGGAAAGFTVSRGQPWGAIIGGAAGTAAGIHYGEDAAMKLIDESERDLLTSSPSEMATSSYLSHIEGAEKLIQAAKSLMSLHEFNLALQRAGLHVTDQQGQALRWQILKANEEDLFCFEETSVATEREILRTALYKATAMGFPETAVSQGVIQRLKKFEWDIESEHGIATSVKSGKP